VNAVGREHGTALQAASFKGHPQIIQMLLLSGADVNIVGGAHNTALHAASTECRPEIVEVLLASGARLYPFAPQEESWWDGESEY
jgi:ankyrin repeat protein